MQCRGQSSHVLVFCVNFEQHICTHITTSIKCYLNTLTDVYVLFTNIQCQSNCSIHVCISAYSLNVNKPSTLHSYLLKKFLPIFKVNEIISNSLRFTQKTSTCELCPSPLRTISISIAIGDGTETRTRAVLKLSPTKLVN